MIFFSEETLLSRKSKHLSPLREPLGQEARKLLSSNGQELVQQIGIEAIREVVYNILCGENFRDSTEFITRRRISFLNLALLEMFLKGGQSGQNFVHELVDQAVETLQARRLPKPERWLAQWILGLTDKAFQNVLRDDPEGLMAYKQKYISVCEEVIRKFEQEYGRLYGSLKLGDLPEVSISWVFMTYLFNAIGAETLTIRGSAKSAYGKLFEKLVLGSLLHILGFQYVRPDEIETPRNVFWLATRGERRESDATLLYRPGKGVRFDIGFIGRGNPELSLDKVTRFQREITLGKTKWYMATIIIVDRIGKQSRIERLAKEVGGTIIQMSMGYWPKEVAEVLWKTLGYRHKLLTMKPSQIGSYLRQAIQSVPLETFI